MKLLAALIALSFSISSFACGPYGPLCGCGHRADSYAYGLKKGLFGSGDTPANYNDTVCFNFGVKDGKKIAAERIFGCDRDFQYSKNQGMNGVVHSSSLTACNNAGYSFGQAQLRVGARTNNVNLVGQSCIDAYDDGRQLARENRVLTIGSNQKRNACLRAGYYDQGWND